MQKREEPAKESVVSEERARARAREAAMREILDVISCSREDDAPVFDVILENAARLCHAPLAFAAMVNDARTHLEFKGSKGEGFDAFIEYITDNPIPLDPEQTGTARAILGCKTVVYDDYRAGPEAKRGSQVSSAAVNLAEARSLIDVPLVSGGVGIGVIILWRTEVEPFTPDEIALVETFAAQAVIAIENVRQFREVQMRLEREKATGQVLSVISRCRADAAPVFEEILESAARLCHAPHALLLLRDAQDKYLKLAGSNSAKSAFVDDIRENPHELESEETSLAVRVLKARETSHIADLKEAVKGMKNLSRQAKVASEIEGMRTLLLVPLMQDDQAIGVLVLYKLEVAPFTADEISLVKSFAAQAVIAIENVRQFKALEALNAELGDRVEEQVGEIERMGKLKRFLPSAVADTVVSSGSEKMLSSHRALLGVLFCDIRGFTAFCETAEPEETIEVLQTYHEEMGKLINAHGAGVDHRMGDGIMVLFNDPLPCDDPAGDAVRLAIAMRDRMAELGQQWKRLGFRLGFGVGVSLGYATVGMVGFEGRFDYTASGTAINLGARLCDEAEDGEILLSPRAAVAVEDEFRVEFRGELQLKGIREPIEVFRVAGFAER